MCSKANSFQYLPTNCNEKKTTASLLQLVFLFSMFTYSSYLSDKESLDLTKHIHPPLYFLLPS